MTRFVYSADGVAFTRYDDPPPSAGRDPILLNTGAFVYLPSVPTGTALGAAGQQGWGIYPIIDSPVQCTPASYYKLEPAGYSWALDGPLLGIATSAVETRVCVLRDAADIHAERLAELQQISVAVRNQGVDVLLSSNGEQAQRTDITSVVEYLAAAAQGVYPGATQATTVDVFGEFYRYAVSDMTPDTLPAVWIHYVVTSANTETHIDALNDLLAADDAQGLADYDLLSGWPAPPTGASSIGTHSPVNLATFIVFSRLPRIRQDPRGLRMHDLARFAIANRHIEAAGDLAAKWVRENP